MRLGSLTGCDEFRDSLIAAVTQVPAAVVMLCISKIGKFQRPLNRQNPKWLVIVPNRSCPAAPTT